MKRKREIKMKVISIFCTAILLVVGLSDMVKADTVNIQYEGKITYGALTVGSFHVDGIRAFCMDHDKTSPSNGTSAKTSIYSDPNVVKCLYYGQEGVKVWSGFNENSNYGIVATTLALDHYVNGSNKTVAKDFIAFLDSVSVPEDSLDFTTKELNAKIQKEEETAENLISCDVINATNLSIYNDNQFDVVLLFGPLYHLLEESERQQCVSEINRVLKPGGKVFASFIPYLSGSIAILDRYYRHPEQVDINNLSEVFESGKFNNSSDKGFQEGYYPSTKEIEKLFSQNGFDKIMIRSIRGFGYEKEDSLYGIKEKEMFDKVISLIERTSEEQSIIDMCGHAIYIGYKK